MPSYSSYMPSPQPEEKVVVNGVALLNRHEISNTQEKELQRFIENHLHLLEWKDREPIVPPKPPKRAPSRQYDDARRSLSRGPSPFEGAYNSMDRFFQNKAKEKNVEPYPTISSNELPICPNIDGHNYTEEFPGLEYLSDNTFIEQMIKAGQVKIGASGLVSKPGSRASSAMGGSYMQHNSNQTSTPISAQQYQRFSTPMPQQNTGSYYASEHSTTNYAQPHSAQSLYSSVGNVGSNYGTLRGGIKHSTATLPPTSPYSSLKRKGVSWSDQERARSLSPGFHQMTNYRQSHQHYARPNSTIHTTAYNTVY